MDYDTQSIIACGENYSQVLLECVARKMESIKINADESKYLLKYVYASNNNSNNNNNSKQN